MHSVIALALLGVWNGSLPALLWSAGVFALLFLSAMLTGLGGGDVKLGTALVWCMGGQPGVIALLLGMGLQVAFGFVYCLIRKRSLKDTEFPLVPFFSVGSLIVLVMFQ